MGEAMLVLNAGSSSVKFQLFEAGARERLKRRLKGQIDGIGSRPRLLARDKSGALLIERSWPQGENLGVTEAIEQVLLWLQDRLAGESPVAVGHRVVHGGAGHREPCIVDEPLLADLERLTPLAPLHQPNNLAAIRAIRERSPGLLQVACFDTAFHRDHAEVAERFAIPDALYREGVRRYGFHGLSYAYIASVLPQVAPELAQGRAVVAHLGSGASLCALQACRSVDTTMGFTALDGLPMGTRVGQVDPGVLLYLLTTKGWDAARLQDFLYKDCGLKGLSGLSNDMRDLLASETPGARLAIDYFVYRAVRETAGLAAAMGGLDGLVFTAGIGENAPAIRSRIGQGLAWLGLEIDEASNAAGGPRISKAGSRLSAWVVPTDEERMIASYSFDIWRREAVRLSAPPNAAKAAAQSA